MKETVNANIGSQAFTLDTDAYGTLKNYLEDVRTRLPEDDTETLGDIEARLAEIFREKTGGGTMRVVTLAIVREAMTQMGAPADFGERRSDRTSENTAVPVSEVRAPRRLYRSRTDRSIAGICGGVAAYFGIDPTLLRLVTLLLILFGGISIWVYIILWIIVPEEPLRPFSVNKKKRINKTMTANSEKKLYRSSDDRMIAGVCAGIADFFGLDVSLVRIATLVLILFGGLSIWVYILLWIIVPKAPKRLKP